MQGVIYYGAAGWYVDLTFTAVMCHWLPTKSSTDLCHLGQPHNSCLSTSRAYPESVTSAFTLTRTRHLYQCQHQRCWTSQAPKTLFWATITVTNTTWITSLLWDGHQACRPVGPLGGGQRPTSLSSDMTAYKVYAFDAGTFTLLEQVALDGPCRLPWP